MARCGFPVPKPAIFHLLHLRFRALRADYRYLRTEQDRSEIFVHDSSSITCGHGIPNSGHENLRFSPTSLGMRSDEPSKERRDACGCHLGAESFRFRRYLHV